MRETIGLSKILIVTIISCGTKKINIQSVDMVTKGKKVERIKKQLPFRIAALLLPTMNVVNL